MHRNQLWNLGALGLVIAIVACGVSCVSAGNARILDSAVVSQIRPGSSTKAEVLDLLGNPKQIHRSESGEESWHYSYARSEMTAAGYAQFMVGIGYNPTTATTSGYQLVVRFDRSGIVAGTSSSEVHS